MGEQSQRPGESDVGAAADPELLRIAEEHERDVDALSAKRLRVGIMLTVAMLVIYFGFILLIAFNKKGLGHLINDGLSTGMVLGVIVVLATWALTWTYVGWANRKYEPEIQRLKAARK